MSNIGDSTDNSIIWVPGETLGRDSEGQSISSPENVVPSGALLVFMENFATESYVDMAVAESVSDFQDIVDGRMTALYDELIANGFPISGYGE